MKKVKRYKELLKLTKNYLMILFKEYRARKFHPYYLNELLVGKSVLFDPKRISVVELGKENPNCIVEYIRLDKEWVPTAGFFALLHKTLCGLYIADKFGFTPVVANWNGCAYEENKKINGTSNVFEYYFQSTSDIGVENALNSANVFIPSSSNLDLCLLEYQSEWFHLSEKYIQKMGEVYAKYIKLNEIIYKEIENDIENLLKKKKTLGIHFRGSDYRLNANGHPISLDVEDYYDYIDEAMKQKEYDQIFIATDDKNALEKLVNRYEKVVYYSDTTRTDGDVSVAFIKGNEKNHKYQLGYEVLRDAYTLARCVGFIGSHSQVGVGVRIIRASKKSIFEYCKIIEPGINRNNKDWVKIFDETIREQ